jgi:hypothetical protein
LLYSYSLLSSYSGSATLYKADGKKNTEDNNVNETYILLSGILAVVVTSAAVRGNMRSHAVDVAVAVEEEDAKCSLYPKIHPLVWLYPRLASVSLPDEVLLLFSWMIYARPDPLLLKENCPLLL